MSTKSESVLVGLSSSTSYPFHCSGSIAVVTWIGDGSAPRAAGISMIEAISARPSYAVAPLSLRAFAST